MADPDDPNEEALRRLGRELNALEAERNRKAAPGSNRAMGDGYRFLGEVIGGVLGGVGLGWIVDHFAHTMPLGMISGMLIGMGVSLYVVIRQALRMAKQTQAPAGTLPSVPDDEDD